jgi:ADP-ribose pyrophosphatase YjhB (NUDIX family)
MKRTVRYQGAIIRDDHILLIRHREHTTGRVYWLLPGGGREAHESEEACVQREMREETQLDVIVERLLLDEGGIPLGVYERFKTYLCKVVNGDAQPGYEPEVEAAQQYAIAEVRWFDLRDPEEWKAQLNSSPFTLLVLQRIRAVLGYSNAGST